MAKRLRLTHELPGQESRHIFHNFGEDLWRLTQGNKRWKVDLDEIDRSDHSFGMVVRSSVLKRSITFIEDLLSKHFLRGRSASMLSTNPDRG